MNTAKKAALVVAAAGMTIGASAGSAFAVGGHGGGAMAHGVAKHSPGVASGNVVQVPVNLDANVCGNTVSVIGALNGAFGNVCVNH